jgi:hypothetical protein
VVCYCHLCKQNMYAERVGEIRCPICFGHLSPQLYPEPDEAGVLWRGEECQGVCGLTWTNLTGWQARAIPDDVRAKGR